MEYLNFDLEITPKQQNVYPVTARSDAGEARCPMRLPWEESALENTLLRVENALLRAGQVRRGTGTPEEQVVQRFGQTLFEALLISDVRRLYDLSAARAAQQGKGLRVRLRIQAPELASLPWEFLYDPLQHEYLCFLPDTVIVRYLEAAQPLPPFHVDPPLRVLAMIADPSDQDRLDVVREQQRLSDALKPLEQRALVKLHWVEGQTASALHQALLQRAWHIFHYIGHGGFDARSQEGVLALVNERGSSQLLSATDLGRLLERRHSLRLVVLNSCQGAVGSKHELFSSTAATLASKRIPAVLAMQYDISDHAAVHFTRGFYEALAVGLPVDEAVTEARTAISVGTAKTLEWVTPVLYLRAPTGLLFTVPQRESGALLVPLPPAATPGPTEPFSPADRPPARPAASGEPLTEGAPSPTRPESASEAPLLQGSGPPSEQQAALEPPVTDSTGDSPLPDSLLVPSTLPEQTRPPATPAAALLAITAEPPLGSPSPDIPRAGLPPDSPSAAPSTGVRPPGISRRAVVLGLAGLGVVGVVGGGLIWFTQAHSGFSDEFNGSLDPRWMWVDPDGDSTHEVTAQGLLRLSIPTANRDLYPANNLDAPRLLQPITGDFTLETRLHFNPTFEYQGAGLLVWEDATRFLRLNRSYFNFSGFTFEQYGNGNYTRILSTDNPGPSVTATVVDLRLQRAGETFTASWRDPSSGQGWQVLGETALHFDTPSVGLLLVAEAQAGNPPNVPTSADYEYFHVS